MNLNTPTIESRLILETDFNPVNRKIQAFPSGRRTGVPVTTRFQDACCARLGIPPTAFEKRVLMASLPPHYRPFGILMWSVYGTYFQPDLLLIRAVAGCASVNQVIAEVNYLHKIGFPQQGFMRGLLRFRMSGNRLIRFAKQFLPTVTPPTK